MLKSLVVINLLLLLSACTDPSADVPATPVPVAKIVVVADGLFGPIGLAALADGTLAVAEEGTGDRDDSAGVSLIQPDGTIGRFISGLPSTRDAGDLAGVPLVKLAPDGATLYVGNFGQGHLWTYSLTPEEQTAGIRLPGRPLTPNELGTAMSRLNNVMLVNPFDMTFDEAGTPIVSDASGNGIATANPDGTTRFFHRFDRLPNPIKSSDPVEAVPTGIARVGDEYYVTLTGGCPYPAGGGKLVAVDTQRNQRTILDGLNMPIDVALGPDGTIWMLEFARFTPDADCFSGGGYQTETGRLSRLLPDGSLQVVLDHLDFPGAVLPMPDGSLYISEVLPGRVIQVTFGELGGGETGAGRTTKPAPTNMAGLSKPSLRTEPADWDALLRDVVAQHHLQPQPGLDLREEDSALSRLGRLLFFDPLLSGDKNIACATCHHPVFAMADGRVLPIGTGGQGLGPERHFMETVRLADEADSNRRLATTFAAGDRPDSMAVGNPFAGQFVPRNSPSIINSALLPLQFWDGRVQSYTELTGDARTATVKTLERTVNDLALTDPLAVQALFPVASLHEMAGATFGGLAPQEIRTRLLQRLRANDVYVALFREVFDTPGAAAADAITLGRVVEALAAFERRFIFTDAPWDRYLAGDVAVLTPEQKRGGALFFGALDPVVNCAQCHSGDLFTDMQFHNLFVPQLGPGRGHGYSGREDWGRAGVTFDARDRYAFRTPSLRNVTLTAPYFHSGAFATLEDAIRHHADMIASTAAYDPSVNGIPPALFSSLQPMDPVRYSNTVAPMLMPNLPLTDADIAALVAFLNALTDPAARDLGIFIPEDVPSGLPLDPLPVSAPPQAGVNSVQAGSPKQPVETDTVDRAIGNIRFRNVAQKVGLDFNHGAFRTSVFDDAVAAMGGGLCWLDYNEDGWLDLYVVNSHAEDEIAYWQAGTGLPRNALFRNEGSQFRDVSAGSGADLAMRGNGCVAADFNNDGHTDLYVTAYGSNALLWNNGDSTFSEGAEAAGVDTHDWSSAAVVGDLNADGLLDLFVGTYIDLDRKIPRPSGAFPQDYYGVSDHLYLNQGSGATGHVVFREVTKLAGLTREERTLGALLSDLDLDGDLDLYIANDGHPNRLYTNDPRPGADGEPGFYFRDLTETAAVGDSGSGMGVASGDYDGDGYFDLFITNWERELNALYRNLAGEGDDLAFQYSTFRIGIAGLGNGVTGWGAHLADFDHDTDTDLLIINGRVPVTNLETDPELVRYYRNRTVDRAGTAGRTGHFLDWTSQVGLKELGLLLGRGSAAADYDNDGDLDVAVNTIAGLLVLLQNSGAQGHWLTFDPGGIYPGLRIEIELPNGQVLRREVHAGSSYLAGEDPRLNFGLGPHVTAKRVSVTWPDGTASQLGEVAADQVVSFAKDTSTN